MEASSKADSPQLWLDGQGMLATTLAEFGARFGGRSAILEANAIVDEIRSTLKAAGYSEQDIDGSYGELAAQIRGGLRDLR